MCLQDLRSTALKHSAVHPAQPALAPILATARRRNEKDVRTDEQKKEAEEKPEEEQDKFDGRELYVTPESCRRLVPVAPRVLGRPRADQVRAQVQALEGVQPEGRRRRCAAVGLGTPDDASGVLEATRSFFTAAFLARTRVV